MEERVTKLEAAVRELQDAAVVMAHLEKRLAETAKESAARIVALGERHAALARLQAEIDQRHAALELSNIEAHEKLNAIIGIKDN